MDIKIIKSQARNSANQRTGDSGAKIFNEWEGGRGGMSRKTGKELICLHGTEKSGRTTVWKEQRRKKAGPPPGWEVEL